MIALIPARGGSKGLPGKNIRPLGGKPLILWTIESAMQATSIDRVFLSTDDEEIAEVCRPTGIMIPFMRPSELAQDDSLAIDNYIYTMDRLKKDFSSIGEEFIVLLPTVPFRNSFDIDSCVELFHEKNADSVISCKELSHRLDWVCEIDVEGRIRENGESDAKKMKNRQELKPAYMPNGGVYVLKHSIIKERYSYYSENTYAYIMPAERSIDIDTELDFNFAQYQMSKGDNV